VDASCQTQRKEGKREWYEPGLKPNPKEMRASGGRRTSVGVWRHSVKVRDTSRRAAD